MHSRVFSTFLPLLLAARVVFATSYLAISDADLTDQAAVIARVTVATVEAGPSSGLPTTSYLVEATSVLKGDLPASTLEVRIPGGVRDDGVGLRIWGAPEWSRGQSLLVFLVPLKDGGYGLLHLMLGAFRLERQGGALVALRDLSEAHRVKVAGRPEPEERGVRDLGRFSDWLADRALGIERPADYWRPEARGAQGSWAPKFTQAQGADGVPIRWFSFDSGGSVKWQMDPTGQSGLDAGRSEERLKAALAAWTGDPTSPIQYTYAGRTGARGGLHASDRVNAVLFNDPGQDVPGTIQCGSGGVLGIGGPFYELSTRSYRGKSYHQALEADVVINDGTQCYFANNPSGLEEVLAHELGHTLGFGHSQDNEAAMRAQAHNDGRGARLSDDDRLAASVVYGDGTFKPNPPPPPPPAAEPLVLTATPVSRTEIRLRWDQLPPAAVALRIERQQKRVFVPMGTVPAGPEEKLVAGLKPNTAYTLRVTALDAAGQALCASNVVKVKTRK